MSKSWSDTLTAIRERVTGRKRLTLRQGEELLSRYEGMQDGYERMVRCCLHLQAMEKDYTADLDEASERMALLIEELNGTYTMLARVLDAKVTGNVQNGKLLWQVEYQGTVSGRTFYAARHITRNGRQTTVRMHAEVMKHHSLYNPALDTHHINHNGCDNRMSNLSMITHRENSEKNLANTSGVTGVSWSTARQKWKVLVKIGGINHHIGYFDDKYVGSAARQQFLQLHGLG